MFFLPNQHVAMMILICQEEEVMLTALEFRLNKQGFDVGTANNKKSAISFIEKNNPALIVADILSEKVDGMDLLLHTHHTLGKKTPFIVLAELEEDESVFKALQAGASDFISKPFNPVELLIRIRRILEK